MKLLEIQYLLLSNAVVGINLNLKKGNLVLINDHINLQKSNPSTGKNLDEQGDGFPDMSTLHSTFISKALFLKANNTGISLLHTGVYAAVSGTHLETKAAYGLLKNIGTDLVVISTLPEVIAVNHINLPCAAISMVKDECDPGNLKPVNIAEIITVAAKADEKLAAVFYKTISEL